MLKGKQITKDNFNKVKELIKKYKSKPETKNEQLLEQQTHDIELLLKQLKILV